MKNRPIFTVDFDNDTKFLKKQKGLAERVTKKIREVLENPEHYKPLRNVLKGKRIVHIGHYVMIYEVEQDAVIFHRFLPHDQAYN